MNASLLREILEYDPLIGVFRWRVRSSRRVAVGDIAGCVYSNGYRYICIRGTQHRAHRLAWLYVHGSWPAAVIDHRNGIRDDNRIENLRAATDHENRQNVQAPQRNNTSGYRGAFFHKTKGRWMSRITLNGRCRHLGYFPTAKEAGAAYLAAKAELHPFWNAR